MKKPLPRKSEKRDHEQTSKNSIFKGTTLQQLIHLCPLEVNRYETNADVNNSWAKTKEESTNKAPKINRVDQRDKLRATQDIKFMNIFWKTKFLWHREYRKQNRMFIKDNSKQYRMFTKGSDTSA